MNEELIKLRYETSGFLALWKISLIDQQASKHVLLTHGTFSNRKVLKGIAEFLTQNGFTCWIFEWRNHGESSAVESDFDFETIGQEDFKTVLNYLFEDCGISNIDCITHSGGGICLTIALINLLEYQERVNSISMFACQAFGAAYSTRNKLQIALGKYFSKLLGYVPAKKIGGEENEPYALMKQWFDWNLQGEFIGKQGIDYQAQMKTIKTPVLSIFGGGDRFIAPPIGCRKYLAAFANPYNKSLYCAKSEGFQEDYNHSRILHSRNANREIYPVVLDWIEANNPS